jgi:uncharacterized membrane protein
MNKKFIFGLLIGWAISILFSPRNLMDVFKPRTA